MVQGGLRLGLGMLRVGFRVGFWWVFACLLACLLAGWPAGLLACFPCQCGGEST